MNDNQLAKPVLLLQIRDNAQIRSEEHESFARFGGLHANQIDVLNVFDTADFEPGIIDHYAALFVGGASEASVLEPEMHRFLTPAIDLLKYCIEQEIPVFASCFGFQLAVIALGGEIVRDKHDFEMGTLPISLSDAAQEDPVFAGIPGGFRAVSVHRERAPEIPDGCELLAYTQACPHAFRIVDKPFWAFQFHPELDKSTLLERLKVFGARYTDNNELLQQVIESAVETPESNRLLGNFVERVLVAREG